MKFSRLLLCGIFLLPFQIHAMDTVDENIGDDKQLLNLQSPPLNQKLFPDQDSSKKKRKKKKKPSGSKGLSQQTVNGANECTDQDFLGQGSIVRLPKNTIKNTMPAVENYIQQVVQHKIEKPVRVHVLLNQEDILAFHDAFKVIWEKYPFPFTWSITNKGLSKVGSEQPSWILELSLWSRAKERERVEKKFVYKISDADKKNANWQNIYDVAMRSGFTLEDFRFNNSIKIRTLELNGGSEVEDLQEFQDLLEQKLAKDENPFHILCLTLNRKAKGHYRDVYQVFLRRLSEANVGYYSRGIVFDSENGLLYLCLDNVHRKTLDLHGKSLASGGYDGRSVKEAAPETQDFILQAYEMFKEDVTVLTGRGNHVNANGQRGILKEAFKDWMEVEPFPSIVESYGLWGGDGGYKVIFKEIQKLNLNNCNPPHQSPIPIIKETMTQMIKQQKARLHIILDETDDSSKSHREFKLLTSLYADLYENHKELAQLITPLSFESTPGEMKIIFNKQHSKSPSSFSFGNSYGSTSTLGTIHYWDQ